MDKNNFILIRRALYTQIIENLFKGKVIIITGPRQVGKTTLLQTIMKRTEWENFLVSERIKANHYTNHYVNTYFWRTHQQQEIDMVEETGGKLYAWEFKWNEKAKAKIPASFLQAYPKSATSIVNWKNYMKFLNPEA